MVLDKQDYIKGNRVLWGKVEKKDGPNAGRWMARITGPTLTAQGRCVKSVYADTESGVVSKAKDFLGDYSGAPVTPVRREVVTPNREKVLTLCISIVCDFLLHAH